MGVILGFSEITALERNRGKVGNLMADSEAVPFSISTVMVAKL